MGSRIEFYYRGVDALGYEKFPFALAHLPAGTGTKAASR
jgi:hypothetical protein